MQKYPFKSTFVPVFKEEALYFLLIYCMFRYSMHTTKYEPFKFCENDQKSCRWLAQNQLLTINVLITTIMVIGTFGGTGGIKQVVQ